MGLTWMCYWELGSQTMEYGAWLEEVGLGLLSLLSTLPLPAPCFCLPTFLCHVIPLNCFSFSMAHSKGNQGWEDWNLSDLESNLSSFGLVTFYWCQQTLDKGNLGRKFFFSWYQRVQSIVRLVPCAWEGYHSSKNVGGSPEWNRKWPEITCTPMFTPKRPTIPEQCHHLGPRIHIMTL